MTGRFEITLYKGSKTDNGPGVLVWSKLESDQFPNDNMSKLYSVIENKLK